jgi:hypothetical protein
MGRRGGGSGGGCGGLSSFLGSARALRLKFDSSRGFQSELRGTQAFDVGRC